MVGVTIAAIGAASIENYTDLMAQMSDDPNLSLVGEIGAKLGGFLASSAVMVFVGLMLFKADELAAEMIGGGGAGSAGVGAVIMNKVMPRGGPRRDKTEAKPSGDK